jgi:hypothetical protein
MSARTLDHLIAQARAVRVEDEIVRRGITLRGRGADRCGPCPRCGGTDRFSINLRKQVFNCRSFNGGDVIAMVQHLDGVSFAAAIETLTGERRPMTTAAPAKPGPKQGEHDRREQHRKAAWLWSRRKPIVGSIAEKYLRTARGIACDLPPTLAFLPAYKNHAPSLIAAFGIADEPEPAVLVAPTTVGAVHLIALQPDGSGKAEVEKPKITIGSPGGLPIVLATPNDLLGLAITEGIEDALTVHESTGLGVWASASAPFLPKLAPHVPDYIEVVTIFAHADTKGQKGARDLADILTDRGLEVFIEGIVS